jgi:DNA-binding XRE family transcriptional regulator
MDEYLAALARAVRNARKKNGLTQVQLAELVNADARTIMNIENCNDDNPKMETLVGLFRVLRFDTNEVFYPDQKEKAPALLELELTLASCSEEEIRALIPICECILESVRSLHRVSAV